MVQTTSFTRSDWQKGYRSLKGEFSYWIDQITGKIPERLQGTLFRNGPGLLDRNGEAYGHPFDGDGMVCKFTFVEGKVHFCNSFVKTREYLAEEAAGKILYRGVFGTQKPGGWWANLFDRKVKSIANTNIVYQGGKLLALWEADRPYRLDPGTLATLGVESFSDKLPPGYTFTAHPRRDPDSGKLWGFRVEPGLKSRITLTTIDCEGAYNETHSFKVPGFCFLHDFAYTADYQVFAQNPIRFNPIPFLLGVQPLGMCLDLQPNTPTNILICDRGGKLHTLPTDPCFIFHHSNAYCEDSVIILDSICYATYPKLEPNKSFLEPDFQKIIPGKLWRFTIDVEKATVHHQVLLDRSCEFPAVHPSYIGKKYRYVYLGATDRKEVNAPLQAIVKLDLLTGTEQIHSFAPRGFVGEPLFIADPIGTAEDEGWVTVLVFNAETDRSELVILNAQEITAPPLAIVPLQHHVPYGLHGSFTAEIWLP